MERVEDPDILFEGRTYYEDRIEREMAEDEYEEKMEMYWHQCPAVWSETEGKYIYPYMYPSAYAAFEWIKAHNLYDEFVQWTKAQTERK